MGQNASMPASSQDSNPPSGHVSHGGKLSLGIATLRPEHHALRPEHHAGARGERASLLSSHGARLTFISDLHLLNTRCDFERHHPSIDRAIAEADVCVWGGDLFDFCWSMLPGRVASQDWAIDWLDRWRERYPNKIFIYITGNHDAVPSFQRRLHQWANRPDFADAIPANQEPPVRILQPGDRVVGLDALRIDRVLLTHGDGIQVTGSSQSLHDYRLRFDHERDLDAHPVANRLYNAAVAGRLHLATASMAHRRRRTCLRLLRWLRSQPPWLWRDLRHIVFGHTHRRFESYAVADLMFSNPGAAVRHVPFEPVRLWTDGHPWTG